MKKVSAAKFPALLLTAGLLLPRPASAQNLPAPAACAKLQAQIPGKKYPGKDCSQDDPDFKRAGRRSAQALSTPSPENQRASGSQEASEASFAAAARLFDGMGAQGSAGAAAGSDEEALPSPKHQEGTASGRGVRTPIVSRAPRSKSEAPSAAAPGTFKRLSSTFKQAFTAALDAAPPTPAALSKRLTAAALSAPKASQNHSVQRGLASASPGYSAGGQRVKYGLEVLTGSAYNAPMPLHIQQAGSPDIDMTANYDTRPFSYHAPYYAWRLSRWEGNSGWELEHIHTKLILANNPPEIQSFAITHGYNYVLLNRAYKAAGLILRVGGGVVVTHPESEVRGLTLDENDGGTFGGGYSLSGVGAQASVSRRFYLTPKAYASIEGKVTGGYTVVPVFNGTATVPALSFHGLLGFGAEF